MRISVGFFVRGEIETLGARCLGASRALLLSAGLLSVVHQTRAADVDFARDIRPLLSDRCYTCHGPDENQREAELRLDDADAILTDGDVSGSPIVVPGDAATSELFARVSATDEDLIMPPPDSNLSLSRDEIELLRRWINEGANWEQHWSFRPPRAVDVPKVKQADWTRNEIDHFVLARLETEDLTPASRAASERLLRRVTFDLTGLPPTLGEVDNFINDQSVDAWERVVDRLLESHSVGERLTVDWLDAARYSDTYGYQQDRNRFVWPWRDWVVRAFNDNMPYDEFITQQVAGDLLPNATRDQILATTFNRLNPQKVEGGSVPEEFRIEYVADRVQTFSTAFLGLTFECARCHDHKYDPLTQREYYGLSAFFSNIDEAGLYSYFTQSVPTPTLPLTDEETERKLAGLKEQISASERRLRELADNNADAFREWLAKDGKVVMPDPVGSLDFEKSAGGNSIVAGRIGMAVRLTGDDAISLKGVGNFSRSQPFSVALWMQTPDVKERAVVYHRSRAWTDAASRGYELLLEDGRLSAALIHFWPGNAIRVRTKAPIPIQQWQHVVVTWDGSSRASGLRIHVNGRPADLEIVRDKLTKNITGGGGDDIAIGQRFRDNGFAGGLVDEFRVFDRELTPAEVGELHSASSKVEPDELHRFYTARHHANYAAERAQLQSLRKQRDKLLDGVEEIMVMRELPVAQQRPTFVLERGAYDARGNEVDPLTPAVLPSLDVASRPSRLDLAKWMTDPQHPLTARVAVNRFWQMLFGEGLVRTPEDFGSQGQSPTHPKLLDWLARDFVANGWNVKRLLKQIVMSSTYQQDSTTPPELAARDPENRLLARMSAFRLSAEMLRDNALAVSGLLVDRIGGAPVKPYELEVSFKPQKPDKGEGLYRRSIYTFWKRSGPAPAMMALDAAKRDVCRVKRERTSSPLQTLVLLNGPQFVEASRALAERLLREHTGDHGSLLVALFRTLTSRHPSDAEIDVLVELHKQQKAEFAADPKAAAKYLAIGEKSFDMSIATDQLAALTVVANTLFGFDDAMMKR